MKRYTHPYVHCSIIYNSQDVEATSAPIDRGMDKDVEYYSLIKKNEILPFVKTWMDLEGVMLSEISQAEKDKYCMFSLISGIWKTKQNRLIDTENKLVVARGDGVGRGAGKFGDRD